MNQTQQALLYEIVGSNIKKRRTEVGLNQTALASKLHLSRTSVVNIEQGRQHPSLHLLWQIAECLRTTVVALLPKDEELILNKKSNPDQVNRAVENSDYKEIVSQFMHKINETS
ncbi:MULTISPECIES: helix-turn-helix transcriptional regulator [unclassified Spirosoma]|uniref:helix-turn-helix domain-containing protein n=1 Tax=unclassified Spirosoma TaxID=2621999 RepID=UPI0009619D72|nr:MULTISPECIES: helix-turn-helix transcriptional regulator [unclassified Spirosoma]MBN8820826.1 helix-turn-helix transcriptional regulator [Spirosoma sp.]OJW71571.1 MAG: hypothetical protein BGO59_26710 [Spirosoma sp. 48-14]